MKSNRIFQHLAVTCAALAFAILPSQLTSAHAQSANFKLTQPTMAPGLTLQPGNYSIRVIDHLQDRLLVQIQGAQASSKGTFIAVPAKSLTGSAGAITWTSAPADKPALRGFNFGQGSPLEFVYPKDEAVSLAKANGSGVLAVDPASESKPAELASLNKEDLQVVTLWMLTPQRVEASPSEISIAAARYHGSSPNPQIASLEKPASPIKRLPHTASALPLILLAGILAALSAGLLHMRRVSPDQA